jgi:uncharacterized damage-inducible protein DinB
MDILTHRYRNFYEHEKDSNDKLLAMLASVPDRKRHDPRFQQAVNIAAHLVACRENWLDRMTKGGLHQVPWFEENAQKESLPARFEATQLAWTNFLADLDDKALATEFTFPIGNGGDFSFYIEGQLIQLTGHGNYHRGQVTLLVDQLSGETMDTDYLFWTGSPDGTYRRVEDEI